MTGFEFSESVRRRVAVFRNRAFRRLLAGRTLSVLGDGFYAVAAMWLVYDLSGSTAYTGLAGFLTRVPGVLKAFVGPLVDRFPLGRTITLSEVAQGLLVLVVPVAAATGHLSVWVVLVAMPLLSLANLFAGPAQNAAVPHLVADEEMVRANSAAKVVGKTVDAAARGVAGAVVAATSAVALYVVDAATFVLAGTVFASLSIPSRGGDPDASLDFERYLTDLREGVGVVSGSVVGSMLAGSLLANFLTGVALAVLPAFADAVGGAETYGLLLAGMTVGSVVGAMLAAAVDGIPLGRTVVVGFVLSGLAWVGAVALPGELLTVALFAASRVPVGVYNVSASATLQTGVPDGLLGRVTALVGSASSLVLPGGMLLGGFLGSRFGSRAVMLAGGVGSVLLAAYWSLVPSLRTFGPPASVSSGEFGGSDLG
ncbi:MFS transporter [Halorussus gelatinilyticus]|uniref:MFS transporter n=1 Tax=Halorussus gelatinilyticus TaxID=2937524 RepID=A0A8U0IHL4_9EURY|nr:MFS transporter [Halorussus gelatinilyticus]UPW00166.1 MFS transporter [Halorussus gelatinilyticus]